MPQIGIYVGRWNIEVTFEEMRAPSGLETQIRARMHYDEAVLEVTIDDEKRHRSATQRDTIDIPAITGQTAFAGFTGATGGAMAQQDILNGQFG